MGAVDGSAKIEVRDAIAADVPAMVRLVSAYRVLLERWEPRFWKIAEDAPAKSIFFFGALIEDGRPVLKVATRSEEVVGFAVLMPTPVPPVYDGGPAATLDDFAIGDSETWAETGKALLDGVRSAGREKGWRQIIVVCPQADERKAEFLASEGLPIVTQWRTAPM